MPGQVQLAAQVAGTSRVSCEHGDEKEVSEGGDAAVEAKVAEPGEAASCGVGPCATLDSFPAEFVQFLADNGVPLEAYRTVAEEATRPRFVRLNPRGALAAQHTSGEARGEAVARALRASAAAIVRWLTPPAGAAAWAEVYECQGAEGLARSESYRDGSLYGVDAASVFAVLCLDPQPGEQVLDLCCAPGAKLCAIGDAVQPGGLVIGVDIAEARLAACRTVVRKYGLEGAARLSLGDGTTWDPTSASWLDMDPPRGRGQRGRKRRLAAAAAAAAAAAGEAAADPLAEEAATAGGSACARPPPAACNGFDRVLVDAECTHDGSFRHIEKFGTQWGWETLGDRVPWVRKPGLCELQVGLLANGFRLLREGGTLVYATCSLCRRQNEDVVSCFLEQNASAELSPLPLPLGPAGAPARPSLLEAQGPLGAGGRYCTARFDPGSSGTSGLFLARISRRSLEDCKTAAAAARTA